MRLFSYVMGLGYLTCGIPAFEVYEMFLKLEHPLNIQHCVNWSQDSPILFHPIEMTVDKIDPFNDPRISHKKADLNGRTYRMILALLYAIPRVLASDLHIQIISSVSPKESQWTLFSW